MSRATLEERSRQKRLRVLELGREISFLELFTKPSTLHLISQTNFRIILFTTFYNTSNERGLIIRFRRNSTPFIPFFFNPCQMSGSFLGV